MAIEIIETTPPESAESPAIVSEMPEIVPETPEIVNRPAIVPPSPHSVPPAGEFPSSAVASPGRGHPLPESVRQQIRDMGAQGMTGAAIAKHFGLAPQTVAYYLPKKSTPSRTAPLAEPPIAATPPDLAQTPPSPPPPSPPPLPAVLAALLGEIPSAGSPDGGTWRRRDDWLGLWNAAVRYCFPTSASGGKSDE